MHFSKSNTFEFDNLWKLSYNNTRFAPPFIIPLPVNLIVVKNVYKMILVVLLLGLYLEVE